MRLACLVIGLVWAASAGAEMLYRLPWADGLSFMFTQVPGGRITSHFTKATLHAVDIAMPEGVPIVAAREPGEEPRAWGLLALWLASGVAGLAWFWNFAKQ